MQTRPKTIKIWHDTHYHEYDECFNVSHDTKENKITFSFVSGRAYTVIYGINAYVEVSDKFKR